MLQRTQQEIALCAETFFFFSKLFYETPSSELVTSIIQAAREEQWLFPFAYAETQTHFETLGQLQASDIAAIELDFTQLFIGPDTMLAPPYASLYIDKEERLFTTETSKVEEFYQQAGMSFQNKETEPSDHIALELMFTGFLLEQYAKTNQQKETDLLAQNITSFWELHLLPWAPSFLDKIIANAQTKFYIAIAYLAKDFLRYIKKN